MIRITVLSRTQNQNGASPNGLDVSVSELREARLNLKFEWLYPEVPAGEWLPAWQVAMQRAERLCHEEDGDEALLRDRLLPPDHFDFQGGTPRSVDWYVTAERLSDAAEEMALMR